MPELPDVEGYRRYFARYAAGERVKGVEVLDREMLRNTSPQGLGRALTGRRFERPRRIGKWLLAPADGNTLVLHFGMTGDLHWSRRSEKGRYDRLHLALEAGTLTYRSKRRLGGVWLARDQNEIGGITGRLGPDARAVDEKSLLEMLSGRRGGIKAALMDQSFVAGIGNELSDEILWQARIDPRRGARELSDGEVRKLRTALDDVLTVSMRRGRIPTEYGWLKSVRGDDGPHCPRCGGPVRRPKVAGRTAYVCEACQS